MTAKAARWLGVLAGACGLAVPMAASAHEEGQLLVRLRGIVVQPDESGSTEVLGGDVSVDTSYAPELDFSYFITKNIAIELIAATIRHELSLKNSAVGSNVDLGHTWVLPPTLLAQYHFFADEIISPYLGVGVNYTVFYDETSGPTADSVDVQNAWGYAFQAGFDIQIPHSRWVINADLKKIFLSPNIDVKVGGQKISDDHFDLDPWVFGVGIGYRFSL
jgi:outer membrane protein